MTALPAPTWDPDRYLTYADHRGRPFVDLVSRVGAVGPATVVDLGCGPGNLTALLAKRWPEATVTGVDSSREMIAAAHARSGPGGPGGLGVVEHRLGDLRDWLSSPDRATPTDVVVSNATLQWLPDHLDLLPALVDATAPGGWLAFQVPGNGAEPSHTACRALAAEPPYAAHSVGAAEPVSHDPVDYLDALTAHGCDPDEVDVWETTYSHLLHGEDPVFTWVSATGARPTLLTLPGDLRTDFEAELKRRLAAAYPVRADGTVVLPFRRVFAVARAPGSTRSLP